MGVECEILWHSSTYACMFSGLGDTNYSNFCNNARNIDRRLSQLGGQRFYPCGFADDAVGYAFFVCVCCFFVCVCFVPKSNLIFQHPSSKLGHNNSYVTEGALLISSHLSTKIAPIKSHAVSIKSANCLSAETVESSYYVVLKHAHNYVNLPLGKNLVLF